MMDPISRMKWVMVIVLSLGATGGAAIDTSLYFDTAEQCEAAKTQIEDGITGTVTCVQAYRVGAN